MFRVEVGPAPGRWSGEGEMARFQIFGLADDLTGALEIGAKFAAAGISAEVAANGYLQAAKHAAALIVDTETRHRRPSEAAYIVQRLSEGARGQGVRLIYKKTDSTLRGNIGAELRALHAVFPESPLVYVPAYPQMGRTVRNARLFVDGTPVEETEFSRDPLNPVYESRIPSLLAAQCDTPVHVVAPATVEKIRQPAIYVCDAEMDADIERAAAGLLKRRGTVVAAGSAAFAGALAKRIDLPRTPALAYPNVRRCLLINGSLHGRSAEQTEHARANGWDVITPEDENSGNWLIFSTNSIPEEGLHRAECVGHIVHSLLNRIEIDALIVFGGDTVFGVLRVLGFPALQPYGEIVPGVPLARIGLAARELYLISKAGGFGPVDILSSIRSLLSGSRAQ